MSKQKYTKGAFIDLVGDPYSYSEMAKFVNNSPLPASDELKYLTKMYSESVDQITDKLEYLAKLEELILQMRAMENIAEMKLSIVRDEYVYARSPFLRIGSSTKDLRIIVGKIDSLGNDLEKLEKDDVFMERAKQKMIKSMKEIVLKTASALPGLEDLSTNLFKDDSSNHIDYPISTTTLN